MARINRNYEKLPGSYLFSEIARRTAAYQEANPDARLIKMGIGDVTRPLAPAVVAAMHAAVDDLAAAETFHGYGPEQGYAFLRDAIAEHDFAARNITIDPDEIFVSDGAKSDCGNIGDIFAEDSVVAVCDPVYPVYVDTNAMAGRAGDYDADAERWTNIVYMPTTAENDFTPALPDVPVDLIYLCSPNNPSGNCFPKKEIEKVIRRFNGIVILDEAYIDFAGQPGFLSELDEYPNLVILQTLSKAWGMAGLRLGLAFAQPLIVDTLSRVKYPYNINVVTQKIVLEQLRKSPDAQIAEIVSERGRVLEGLAKNPVIRKIHPTDANFVLVEVDEPRTIYDRLIGAGIIVRDRSRIKGCEGCLRITIGTPKENDRLLETLKKL